MKYQIGDYEAVHQFPIWGDRANCVFAAHLGRKDGKNEWERLWGEKTKDNTLTLCCIPFFLQDVSLGDEVRVDKDYVLEQVVRQSGQVTFRVWFGAQGHEQRSGLVDELCSMEILMEWSSENLLALSAKNEDQAQRLANMLQVREAQGRIQYETGRSKKF